MCLVFTDWLQAHRKMRPAENWWHGNQRPLTTTLVQAAEGDSHLLECTAVGGSGSRGDATAPRASEYNGQQWRVQEQNWLIRSIPPTTDGGKDKSCVLVNFFLWCSRLARGMAAPMITFRVPEFWGVGHYSSIKFCIILVFSYVSFSTLQCNLVTSGKCVGVAPSK